MEEEFNYSMAALCFKPEVSVFLGAEKGLSGHVSGTSGRKDCESWYR